MFVSDYTYERKVLKQIKTTNTKQKEKRLYCEIFKTLPAIASIGCCPNIYSSVYFRISRMSGKDQTTIDLCQEFFFSITAFFFFSHCNNKIVPYKHWNQIYYIRILK